MNNILPKWLTYGLGGLLIIFVALLVVNKAYSLKDVLQNKNPQNTISISAEGKVKAVPDLATVNLGLLTQGSTPSQVQDENTTKVNKIIDYIKKQGISKDDISTSQFNIYPQYNYQNGRNDIIGYQLNQTLTVKIRKVNESTDQLNKILKGSVSEGANEVSGVTLGFDNPDNLRQQARQLAIQNAREKARELAETAGLNLGKVVSISETALNYPSPYYADYGLGAGGLGGASAKVAAPNIEPGNQDIIENMTVIFEIR